MLGKRNRILTIFLWKGKKGKRSLQNMKQWIKCQHAKCHFLVLYMPNTYVKKQKAIEERIKEVSIHCCATWPNPTNQNKPTVWTNQLERFRHNKERILAFVFEDKGFYL